MAATLKTLTLGCKVNQYETELVREGLLRASFRDATEGEAVGHDDAEPRYREGRLRTQPTPRRGADGEYREEREEGARETSHGDPPSPTYS